MAGKPNPRRALALRLQDVAQMLAGNADSVDKSPDDAIIQNVKLICLKLDEAGEFARQLEDVDTSIVIEETRVELRTHLRHVAMTINLSGLTGVAERCCPRLLGAYARIVVTPADETNQSPPGKPGRKADSRIKNRNCRIKKLWEEDNAGNNWARLADLANKDPQIQKLGLSHPVTKDVARNAVKPPRKRGTNQGN